MDRHLLPPQPVKHSLLETEKGHLYKAIQRRSVAMETGTPFQPDRPRLLEEKKNKTSTKTALDKSVSLCSMTWTRLGTITRKFILFYCFCLS